MTPWTATNPTFLCHCTAGDYECQDALPFTARTGVREQSRIELKRLPIVPGILLLIQAQVLVLGLGIGLGTGLGVGLELLILAWTNIKSASDSRQRMKISHTLSIGGFTSFDNLNTKDPVRTASKMPPSNLTPRTCLVFILAMPGIILQPLASGKQRKYNSDAQEETLGPQKMKQVAETVQVSRSKRMQVSKPMQAVVGSPTSQTWLNINAMHGNRCLG